MIADSGNASSAGTPSAPIGLRPAQQPDFIDQACRNEGRRHPRAAFDHQPRDALFGQRAQHRRQIQPRRRARSRRRGSPARRPRRVSWPPALRRDPTSSPRAASRARNAPGGWCRECRSARSSTTRTGERASMPGRRQVSSGSSASTVPMPTRMASHCARNRCTRVFAASPVIATGLWPAAPILSSAETASLRITCGRLSRMRRKCPA